MWASRSRFWMKKWPKFLKSRTCQRDWKISFACLTVVISWNLLYKVCCLMLLCFSNTVTSHSTGCWPVIYCMVFTLWSLCSDDDGRWLHYFTWVYLRRYWTKSEDIQTTDQPSKFSFCGFLACFGQRNISLRN